MREEGIKYRYDGSRYDTSWKFSNFFADVFGILTTFLVMGIATVSISVISIHNAFRRWRKVTMERNEWL